MVIRTLFIYTRPAANFGNNRSAIQNREFVEQAICDLLRQAQWLSVSIQAGGKKRLILVLRYPNQFLRKSKIEFEDAKTMLYSFIDCSQNWLFSFDIKSGYHHIDIFSQIKSFWAFPGLRMGRVIRFYKFTVLPFGISTGPYIFSNVLRPLIRYWRLQAIRIVVYLDDGLGVCPTFSDCYSRSMAVKLDLSQAGLSQIGY